MGDIDTTESGIVRRTCAAAESDLGIVVGYHKWLEMFFHRRRPLDSNSRFIKSSSKLSPKARRSCGRQSGIIEANVLYHSLSGLAIY
jgi:hypothetical protein